MKTGYTISIVDDATDFQHVLKQLFHYTCPTHQVNFFSSGRQFLNALRQMEHFPDLIMLDHHMPDFDGPQTLAHLKKHPIYQTIPIVMMSYEASSQEVYSCYQAGANSFLIKPVGFDALRQTVQLICEYWLEHNEKSIMADNL